MRLLSFYPAVIQDWLLHIIIFFSLVVFLKHCFLHFQKFLGVGCPSSCYMDLTMGTIFFQSFGIEDGQFLKEKRNLSSRNLWQEKKSYIDLKRFLRRCQFGRKIIAQKIIYLPSPLRNINSSLAHTSRFVQHFPWFSLDVTKVVVIK